MDTDILEKGKNSDSQMKSGSQESNVTAVPEKHDDLRARLYPWATLNVSGWTTFFGNSSYFFSNQKLNWAESRNSCLLMLSDLVVINNEAEQTFLTNSTCLSKEPYWIGFTDQKEESKWCWVDDQYCNATCSE
ncbi:CD209 antigen-like protein B [Protopterus annectens]|uniref:CD209 antigen-like protein B n=1 Tax=Protopterus annectens TaxID=7888 RepID=UPI001CFC0380|nr:CD209 antigen-like protein B [Protopterus annectens]